MLKVIDAPLEKQKEIPKSFARWYAVTGRIAEWCRDTETGAVMRIGLEEAKRMFLLPSATTILKIDTDPCGVMGFSPKDKGLEQWLVKQGADIQNALEKIPGESDQDRHARVIATYKAQSNARLSGGKAGHALFEALHRGEPIGKAPEEIRAALEGYAAWYGKTIRKALLVEEPIVSRRGYAGTLDNSLETRDGRPILADTKIVDDGPKWQEKAYSERGEQLAAYAAALYERGLKIADAWNILVNKRTGEVRVHSWRDAAVKNGEGQKWLGSLFQSFERKLRLFQQVYDYDTAAAYKHGVSLLRAREAAKGGLQAGRVVNQMAIGNAVARPRVGERIVEPAGGVVR